MQKRFTIALKCKQDLMEQVKSRIWASLYDLRNIIQTEKTFKTDYKLASEYINMVIFKHKEIVDEIARIYILMPSYIHSINLVRWYGQFRNKGRYNKDTYFTARGQIEMIQNQYSMLLARGLLICPTKQFIKQAVRKRLEGAKNVEPFMKPATELMYLFKALQVKKDESNSPNLARLVSNYKKLPAILPSVDEHKNKYLDELIMEADFSEMKLNLTPLDRNHPPEFSLESAYPGKTFPIIDLAYLVIAQYYFTSKNL